MMGDQVEVIPASCLGGCRALLEGQRRGAGAGAGGGAVPRLLCYLSRQKS